MKRVLSLLVAIGLWFSAFTPVLTKGQDRASQVLREQNPNPQVEQDSKLEVKFRRVEQAIPNRYIVVFKEDSLGIKDTASRSGDDRTDQSDNLARQREEVGQRVEAKAVELARAHRGIIGQVYKYSIKGFAAKMTEADAMALSENPEVKYVEEDGLASADTTQQDATWGLDRIDQSSRTLNNTYVYNSTGAGVNAYVIDTGIRITHDEFGDRAAVAFDAIDDDDDGDTPTSNDRRGSVRLADGIDGQGHGTHVAGTIGGETFGVAKDVRLHAVRVLGRTQAGAISNSGRFGRNSEIIAGIDWVKAHHVKPAVANMSFGGSGSDALDESVRQCVVAGITCVVAAGNSNMNASNQSPARLEQAITVGATDISDNRWRDSSTQGSNFGPALDVFAPGDNITSAGVASDTATAVKTGTSMAAPHVAGVAARYLERNPQATTATVQLAIVMNATRNKVVNRGAGSLNRLLYSSFNTNLQLLTSDPAAVSWGWGRIDVFARGADNALWHMYYYDNRVWSTWESLGGDLASGPAVCSWESGRLDIFARSRDNKLLHKYYYDNRVWSGWETLGGQLPTGEEIELTSDPAAVSWGWGRVDVFARGADYDLLHIYYYDNRTWGNWESKGGYLTSGPAVCSWESGRLDVFARGNNNNLLHLYYYDNRVWGPWEDLGGYLTSAPDAVSWGWGRVDVFARGFGSELQHKYYYDNRVWADWYPVLNALGGSEILTSGPGVSSWGYGRLDIFARGARNGLLHKYYYDNRVWADWYYL